MNKSELITIASALVAPGKGILAADESNTTIKKRFDLIKLAATEANRRAFRELTFTTAGAAHYISGVILYDETIRQQTEDGRPFPQVLAEQGIIPGIKADTGLEPLAGFPSEQITKGLDGLRERLAEYHALGARFAKWRAVIDIGPDLPTRAAIAANAAAMARYAASCQEAGLVPIVEPEVLMDGSHTIERCEAVTTLTLKRMFDALYDLNVLLEGTLLKPNMVLPGKKSGQTATPEQIAEATLRCFRRVVPAAVPGIVFLSGGQSPQEATANLNAMNAQGPQPWQLSFSYGRALQEPVLQAWQGKAENVAAAQQAYLLRAQCNSAARDGSYTPAMEA